MLLLLCRRVLAPGGIKAVANDEYIIGRVARKIKEQEQGYGLTYVGYANLPIVFYVNRSAGVNALTSSQINDIYSGAITNWSDVGGSSGKIRVIRREEGDSSLKVILKTVPGFKDITLTKRSKTTFSDPETIELCENTSRAIAFGTWPDIKDNPKLAAIVLDGVKMTATTLLLANWAWFTRKKT